MENKFKKRIFDYKNKEISYYLTPKKEIYFNLSNLAKIFDINKGNFSKTLNGLKYNTDYTTLKVYFHTYNQSLFHINIIKLLDEKFKTNHYQRIIEIIKYKKISNNNLITINDDKIYEYYDDNQGNIIKVEIDKDNKTIWLSLEEIAILYKTSKANISMHIKNIFLTKEIDINTSVKENLTNLLDGRSKLINFYNLKVVFAVGYRINNVIGIRFRNWATSIIENRLNLISSTSYNCITCKNDIISLLNNFDTLKNKVNTLENKINEDKVIYQGDEYTAFLYFRKLFKSAKKEITIIDPYIDNNFYIYLKDIHVDINIFTSNSSNINLESLNKFNIKIFDNIHDRFIFIDDNYGIHIGGSIKDAGKKLYLIIPIKIKKEIIISSMNIIE